MADNIKTVQAQTFTLAGAGVSAGDTSMVLNNFHQIDGTLLTLTNFGIKGFGTNEPASGTYEEQISFSGVTQNGDGTATLTGIHTVSDVDPYTEISGFAQGHAGGTAFVISNTSGYQATFANKMNDETITGTWLVPDPTVPTQIANKEYVDDIAIAGAPNATTSLQGLVQLATQAQYDSKTAIGSTTAALVSPPNLNRATKYNDYVVDSGSANIYVITPNPAIVTYVAGQQFTWKVTHTNTTASTLNVNGVGAIAITKNISSPLTGGELVINSIVSVIFDGTNFQIQNSTDQTALTDISFGQITRMSTDGTGTQLIAHGLGVPPTLFKITWFLADAPNGSRGTGTGCMNASLIQNSSYFTGVNNESTSGNDNVHIIAASLIIPSSTGFTASATAVDATDITLNWIDAVPPLNGGGTRTLYMQWEAYA